MSCVGAKIATAVEPGDGDAGIMAGLATIGVRLAGVAMLLVCMVAVAAMAAVSTVSTVVAVAMTALLEDDGA